MFLIIVLLGQTEILLRVVAISQLSVVRSKKRHCGSLSYQYLCVGECLYILLRFGGTCVPAVLSVAKLTKEKNSAYM